MKLRHFLGSSLLLSVLLAAACTPAGSTGGPANQAGPSEPAKPKRITVSVMDEPTSLSRALNAPSVRGIDVVEELTNAAAAIRGRQGGLQPQLATELPTIANGGWKTFPDGRMETTWALREGARWHDGAPLSAEDFVFTAAVAQDRELAVFAQAAYENVEDVQAPDARTVLVRWKRPYIDADSLFTSRGSMPLPRHLLERAYQGDKAGFLQLPYWTNDYVGSGPFRVKEWVQGTRMTLEASELYVLGRPKLDSIEVRFISDPNALAANVLAGTIDLTLGRGLDLERAILIRDQWRDGRMDVAPTNWLSLWPQLLTPNPPIVGDARFRRALLTGLDRQELVDRLMGGFSSVAHSYINPEDAEYPAIGSSVVRYDYDPARAAQMMDALGYRKGADGMLRDGAGQRIEMELRTTDGDLLRQKVLLSASDFWQRMGIAAEPYIVPRQRAQDQEYRATFPAFELVRQPNSQSSLASLHSRAARLPDNNFVGVGGTNYARYMNPEFDAQIDRFFVTIPKDERLQVLGQVVHHISDQLNVLGLFYAANPTMIASKLVGVTTRNQDSTEAWNAQLWDVQ